MLYSEPTTLEGITLKSITLGIKPKRKPGTLIIDDKRCKILCNLLRTRAYFTIGVQWFDGKHTSAPGIDERECKRT